MARYPKAQWIGSPNSGGAMGRVALFVVHIAQGTLVGTDNWFNNPASQVSAHFGVGKEGEIHQYVDTSVVAWAEAAFNNCAISIEHEGQSGDTLTPKQLLASITLLQWLHKHYPEVPLRHVETIVPGVIGHGQLGVAGGNHPDCPGQPILDQFRDVLNVDPVPPVLVNGVPRPPGPLPTLYRGMRRSSWTSFLHACLDMPFPRRGGFGAITYHNVRALQRSRGGPADGVVGPQTWKWMGQE